MTKKEYQKLIPEHCSLRTFEEHSEELMGCWGISHGFITEKTARV